MFHYNPSLGRFLPCKAKKNCPYEIHMKTKEECEQFLQQEHEQEFFKKYEEGRNHLIDFSNIYQPYPKPIKKINHIISHNLDQFFHCIDDIPQLTIGDVEFLFDEGKESIANVFKNHKMMRVLEEEVGERGISKLVQEAGYVKNNKVIRTLGLKDEELSHFFGEILHSRMKDALKEVLENVEKAHGKDTTLSGGTYNTYFQNFQRRYL